MTAESAARYIAPQALADMVAHVLSQAGCPSDIAAKVSENLVDAEMCGHASMVSG
jgi:LDH2 family malate/lactate/ureidoglycolate dehydrogenase